MLLFIVKSEHLRQNLPDSNTSHVIVYHTIHYTQTNYNPHSNTSHVIVYLRWCLFLYILHDDSNTSHVIVYP